MAKKTETTETPPQPKITFKQIMGDAEAIYALDDEGRVYLYLDDDTTNEHGWYQLEYDDVRMLAPPEDEDED